MQPPYDHYPESAESAPPPQLEIIPYDEDIMGKASRLMGRISMGVRGNDVYVESELNPRPLPYLLDTVERHGVSGEYTMLDVGSPMGHELADSFMKGPELEQQVFIKRGVGGVSRPIVSLHPTEGNPIWLPTKNFVFAPGLSDWTGDGRKKGAARVSSKSMIRSHVRSGAPTALVPDTMAYVQPNGQVLYSVVSDGGHRVASAIARQDKAIPVAGRVLVRRLPTNLFPLAQRK